MSVRRHCARICRGRRQKVVSEFVPFPIQNGSPLQNAITYILDVSNRSMKKAVLHVALKFAHREVAVFLLITLALKATSLSFYTVTDVPEVGGHMNWSGCPYGHNLKPHVVSASSMSSGT